MLSSSFRVSPTLVVTRAIEPLDIGNILARNYCSIAVARWKSRDVAVGPT